MSREDKIAEIEKQIADLEARFPKHSVPPSMIIELEDLETELQRLKRQAASGRE